VSDTDVGVIRSSSVMAAGTVTSRVTGVLRSVAIAAAIGNLTRLANAYNTANTLPNIIYILLVGGALNAVFIPQLVRHMKDDTDSGKAYADRLLTLSGLVLLLVTVVAVVTAPLITPLYAGNVSARQVQVTIWFAYLCLPQIFFYGMYALYSQVLNTRGRFGAPMFAPIVNNLVVIVGCLVFLARGAAVDIYTLTWSEVLLLGGATTLGVVAQAAVLVPVLSRAGYRFRPRFDLRGQGLGRAVTLARWTIFYVAVNQLTFLVITRLANTAGRYGTAAGSAAYANAQLMFILPHSIITVSVVTALMPRMSRAAHAGDLAEVRHDLSGAMRLVASAMVPATVLLLLLGPSVAELLLSYGNADDAGARAVGHVLQGFTVGLLGFTVYYVLLRGFYALEDTRTPALWGLFLNAVNLAVGYALFTVLSRDLKVVGLAIGYSAAYVATALVFWLVLRRRLGGLDTYVTVRTLVRLVIAGVLAAAAGGAVYLLVDDRLGSGRVHALVACALVAPVVLAVFTVCARRMRVPEVGNVIDLVARRLRRA
jgi:putative peptidoglycan lipid II flippase